MSDDERMDRLEARVERAGEASDEPHQEMAQTVADATVEAGADAQRKMVDQMRGLLRDVKWFIVVIVLIFGLIVVLSK